MYIRPFLNSHETKKKDAACCFGEILEVTLNKTAFV